MDVQPTVVVRRDTQAGFKCRIGHQLPDTGGAISARGDRRVVALEVRQEGKLARQAMLFELVDHQQQIRHRVGEGCGELSRALRVHPRPVLDRGVVVAARKFEARAQPRPWRFADRRGSGSQRVGSGDGAGAGSGATPGVAAGMGSMRGVLPLQAANSRQKRTAQRGATTAKHRQAQVAPLACRDGPQTRHADAAAAGALELRVRTPCWLRAPRAETLGIRTMRLTPSRRAASRRGRNYISLPRRGGGRADALQQRLNLLPRFPHNPSLRSLGAC